MEETPAPPAPSDGASGPPLDEGRVAAVLEQLRSGVRQRMAEVAAVGAGADAARHRLVELASREYVEEPVPVSPRPVVGKLLVFARKAVFHLFLKWYTRPELEQQNSFNESASRLIEPSILSFSAWPNRLR